MLQGNILYSLEGERYGGSCEFLLMEHTSLVLSRARQKLWDIAANNKPFLILAYSLQIRNSSSHFWLSHGADLSTGYIREHTKGAH